VQVARYVQGLAADYVGPDNVQGALLAVRYLVGLGHRQIAFVGGPQASSARTDRLLGFRRGIAEAGLTVEEELLIPTPVTRADGFASVQRLLAQSASPSAILCYNDVVALGVMLGLGAAGLEAGRDVSVVGFDDIDEAALSRPALTTIAIPPSRVGEEAATLMLARIEDPGGKPRRVVLSPELVIRDSCGSPV
jgi:LacI family transcriptional regulator